MYDKLKKKKEGSPKLSDVERGAKSSVLKDLSEQAGKAISGKISGLKKVSVMSPDPEGLKAGLEKAKELVGSMPEMHSSMEPAKRPEEAALEEDDSGAGVSGSDEEGPEHEASESPDEEYLEHAQSKSADELDHMIQQLEALKRSKS